MYTPEPRTSSVIHTRSPWASVLAAARQELGISQMDVTPLHEDCAFLGECRGLRIADYQGVVISQALGKRRRSFSLIVAVSPPK
jgi:L-fuculose-phosphate aldolase